MLTFKQKMFFNGVFFLCLFNITTKETFAASYDCLKATTSVEQVICFDDDLSFLDEKLDSIYRETISKSFDKNRLRSEQTHWLQNIRNKCTTVNCLFKAYKNRIAILKNDTSTKKKYNDESNHHQLAQKKGIHINPGQGDSFANYLMGCVIQGYPVIEKDMVVIRTKTKGPLRLFEYEFPMGCGLSDSKENDIQGTGTIINTDQSYTWSFSYSTGNRKKLINIISNW